MVTKVAGSGGAVTARTVKEQLLYEIHDPTAYLQPDVIADFSEVRVEEIGPDRVRVTGGKGAPKTGLLKTSVGYVDSYVGEGQISYAGPNAVARGKTRARHRARAPRFDRRANHRDALRPDRDRLAAWRGADAGRRPL